MSAQIEYVLKGKCPECDQRTLTFHPIKLISKCFGCGDFRQFKEIHIDIDDALKELGKTWDEIHNIKVDDN